MFASVFIPHPQFEAILLTLINGAWIVSIHVCPSKKNICNRSHSSETQLEVVKKLQFYNLALSERKWRFHIEKCSLHLFLFSLWHSTVK